MGTLKAHLLGLAILLSTNAPGFSQTTNNWTSGVTGNWHDLSWSLGIRPTLNHSAFITNGGSKAVFVNNTTRDVYTSSMTVSNVTVGAPSFDTNTLLLNYTGTGVPFTVLDHCDVRTNGVLMTLFSSLSAVGPFSTVHINGGSFIQEGGSNYFAGYLRVGDDYSSGRYIATNGVIRAKDMEIASSGSALIQQYGGQTFANNILIGRWGRPGTFFVTNGLVRAGSIVVQEGNFFQANSDVLCTNNFTVSADYQGNFADYKIAHGGTLRTPSIRVQGFIDSYEVSFGHFDVDGGAVFGDEITRGDMGTISQTAGVVSIRGNVRGGINLSGGMLMSSNTHIYNPSHFVMSASYTQSGGTNITTNTFEIGDARYVLEGGLLDVGHLLLRPQSFFQHDGGTFTNRAGVTFAGGALATTRPLQRFGFLKVTQENFGTASAISLPQGSCILQFDNSSAIPWGSTAMLNIHNWNGSTNGGGLHRIMVGANGLTPTQLEQVVFVDPAGITPGHYSARLLNTGEVVPSLTTRLASRRTTEGITLFWPGTQRLQSATNVLGPYLPVSNSYSPYLVPASSDPARFFRLSSAP